MMLYLDSILGRTMECIYIHNTEREYITLPPITYPLRLDSFLHIALQPKGISREKIKQYIHQGYVTLHNNICTRPATKIHGDAHITITIPTEYSVITQEEGDIDIVYEDADLIIVNKPHAMVVHPCPSTPHSTLLQRLLFHYPELYVMGGERPAIVHRLDKDTTGLLIVARTEYARYALVHAFKEHNITKHYLALVQGEPPAYGTITFPIGRDTNNKTKMTISPKGKEAFTEYQTLTTIPTGILPYPVSLLHIHITTGRTHQIRVHLSSIGFPILGDTTYGALPSHISRPLLHAFTLDFTHPRTQEALHYIQMPPHDFEHIYLSLRIPSTHVILTGSASSGKSTALQYYMELGIPCCSADAIIDELYQEGKSIWHYLKQSYGTRFFQDEHTIDKTKVLEAMHNSPYYKEELERVIHSFLISAIHEFWHTHRGAEYTIVEVPLYFESALFQKECPADIVITVLAPLEERIKRMRNNTWSETKIQYVIENQYDDEYKKEHSDYVLTNTGESTLLHMACKESITYITQHRSKQYTEEKNIYRALLMQYTS